MAKIQIDADLFSLLVKYHLLNIHDDSNINQSIKAGLQGKLDAMQRRQSYTTFKTSSNAKDKEQARQDYLDQVGIPKDFRY